MENFGKFSEIVYTRPDFELYKSLCKDYKARVEAATSADDVLKVIYESDEKFSELSTMTTVMHIRHTLDTRDKFYEEENDFTNENFPLFMPYIIELNQAIAGSPFKTGVEEKLGKQYFVGIDMQKKMFSEKNIPLQQRESKLCDEYQKLMASAQIDFDGQTLNLYGITKYFESEDRSVREAAWRKYSAFYSENESRLEKIWAELLSIRNEMGRNLGFKNYIPLGYMRQGRTDYGVDEVASFRNQVLESVVPLADKLYAAQKERLGIDELYAFDEKRIFADGNAHPMGDDDFMIEQAKSMYHELSPETAEFIDFMIEHELMDLKNKPGKASTGYMTSLDKFKAPFVFSCFNGTIGDMQVLTHELGHAFAGYMAMRNQPVSDYYSESTDIAEIHSMAMEQFSYGYAERFFGKDADKFRFAHLQDAVTFIPFGVAVDEFQHIMYENEGLSPKERTLKWKMLEAKYMPWRKYKSDEFMERGGYWYHKLHIYLYPFYYINYTLTSIGALEFKKKFALNRDEAWNDYLNLCKVGGSKSYLETLAYANLNNPFANGSVRSALDYTESILLEQIKKF